MPRQLQDSQLILASGEVFSGFSPLSQQQIFSGEIVFNTGMVGYVESLTDPSYAGQILCFTYPLIGNYGVPPRSVWESGKIQVSGVIFSSLESDASHHEAEKSLQAWLEEEGIPFISGVDTRALTKVLREQGVAPGAIAPLGKAPSSFPELADTHWVAEVSCIEPEVIGSGDKTLIVVDCGIKENILRHLSEFPWQIKRVPYNYDFSDEAFDAVFISNGPGDPIRCEETISIVKKVLEKDKPVFGICLGSQIMALAIGAETYKLPFGHRAQNQPCIECGTDKAFLTSQNHGYAVAKESLPADWEVGFLSLNDNTVQGIHHKTKPFFAVQFHPEAAPGPYDTQWLFDKFYRSVAS